MMRENFIGSFNLSVLDLVFLSEDSTNVGAKNESHLKRFKSDGSVGNEETGEVLESYGFELVHGDGKSEKSKRGRQVFQVGPFEEGDVNGEEVVLLITAENFQNL